MFSPRTSPMRPRYGLALLALASGLLVGCSNGSGGLCYLIGGRAALTGQPVSQLKMEFRPRLGGDPLERTIALDAAGNFSLPDIPAGAYDVVVSAPNSAYLTRTLSLDSSAGPVSNWNVSLPIGDINGDGQINTADYTTLVAAFGSTTGGANWNPKGDLNNDGKVDEQDRQILLNNLPDVPCDEGGIPCYPLNGKFKLTAGCPIPQVKIEFRPTGGGTTLTRTVTPNAEGNFTVSDVRANSYNVTVSVANSGYVNRTLTVNTTLGGVSNWDVSLPLGDINRDGVINNTDLQRLIAAFNSTVADVIWNPNADLNCDGSVDVLDQGILAEALGDGG